MNTEYKNKAPIIILEIIGIELNINLKKIGLENKSKQKYCRLFGEFYYCGLSLQGHLILSEKSLNKIIEKLLIIIVSVDGNTMFIELANPEQEKILHEIKLRAECLGDEEFESDVDENYIFILIEKK